jgi:hypothetical protein
MNHEAKIDQVKDQSNEKSIKRTEIDNVTKM